MPKNWKTYKLEEIALTNTSTIGKDCNLNEILYLDTGSVTEGRYDIPKSISLSDAPSRAKRVVKNNDIIYSTVRPNQKHYGLIVNPKHNLIVSTGFCVISPIKVNPKFLYYYLTTDEMTNYLQTIAEGSTTTYPSIKPSVLEGIEINLPPLPEQKAIANIISAIDDKIENNLAINKTLEDMAMALYKHWFVEFGPFQDGEFIDSELGLIPKGWEVKRIGDLIEVINGFAFKSKWFQDHGEKVVKIKNISNNVVNINNCNCISSNKALEVHEKFKISPGDFLIAMTGAEVGKTGVVPDYKESLWLNQRVGMLKDKAFKNSSILVGKILQSKEYYDIIQGLAYGSAQPNISSSGIENIEIILPIDFESIDDLIQEFVHTQDKIIHNLTENLTLTKLRNTLLPKLISGEVRLKEFREEAEQVV